MSSVSRLQNDLYFSLGQSHTCSFSFQSELLRFHKPFLCLVLSRAHVLTGFVFSSICCCTTGIIKTALPNMDREVKEQYQVLIQAKDMGGQLGGLAGTTTVNITLSDVNDNPPRFSKSKCCL